MSELWVSNDLPDAPHRIRPETHWLYDEIGHDGGPLWFSLQLSHSRAAELRSDQGRGANGPRQPRRAVPCA